MCVPVDLGEPEDEGFGEGSGGVGQKVAPPHRRPHFRKLRRGGGSTVGEKVQGNERQHLDGKNKNKNKCKVGNMLV